jgi:hypothetical protein
MSVHRAIHPTNTNSLWLENVIIAASLNDPIDDKVGEKLLASRVRVHVVGIQFVLESGMTDVNL